MSRYNSLSGIPKLIVDVRNNRVKAFSKDVTTDQANEILRQKINEMLPPRQLTGKIRYNDFVKFVPQVFDIISEVLYISVIEAYKSIPFFQKVVDFRVLALGDQNEFVVKDSSYAMVRKFAGNTWDTERQKMAPDRAISMPTEWFFTHVYEELERFLIGATSIDELMTWMENGWIKHINDMISTVFNGAGSKLPSVFNQTGTLSVDIMRELTSRVRTASRGAIEIYGTEMALAQLNDLADIKYSENMINEVYNTGRLGKWMGIDVVEIPQYFNYGTYDFGVRNDELFILPAGIKPIKFVDEGETRSLVKNENDNHDQTYAVQLQRKMGCGLIMPTLFGKFTIV